jgi:hypothetical protein
MVSQTLAEMVFGPRQADRHRVGRYTQRGSDLSRTKAFERQCDDLS